MPCLSEPLQKLQIRDKACNICPNDTYVVHIAEVYVGHSQTPTMELSAKIAAGC